MKISRVVFLAGTVLVAAFLVAGFVSAAEEDISAALHDLSSALGQDITNKEQAVIACDAEKNFETCAEIGKKHDLYQPEEIAQVNTVLDEIKGEVATKLQTCQSIECLVGVANELAQKVNAKNPTVATNLDLTPKIVEKKQAIVAAAKEAGISYEQCRNMDPDTAPVDLLRACARLAKDSRVRDFVPEQSRQAADFADSSTDLKEALQKGEVQCGDNTLQGCGNFCLNPSAETRAQGIPPVCNQIATRFFGTDGTKELKRAYKQVEDAGIFYRKKADNLVFTTLDGRVLTDPSAIGNYMENEGRKGNVEAVDKGMDFLIGQGFVKPEEKEYALKFVRKVREKGGEVNFDTCTRDPKSCSDFIPDEQRGQFEAFDQIHDIMRQEIGFDPERCRDANFETGEQCLRGSERAIAKVKSLGLERNNPQVRSLISDIESKVNEGKRYVDSKDQIDRDISSQGGPGDCRSSSDCLAYCSDANHGPECLSFGAKQGVFRGEEVIQKFQQFNQNVQAPRTATYDPARGFEGFYSSFPGGQGPYPGFQPPGQSGFQPPGQIPGFTQPGPGYSPPPGQSSIPYYPDFRRGGDVIGAPVGPSPECFAAIQSGDYARARTACYVPSVTIYPTFTPIGSPVEGCQPPSYFDPGIRVCRTPYTTYSVPPGDQGQYCPPPSAWDPATRSCRPYPTPYTSGSPGLCPSGQWWDGAANRCTSSSSCGYGFYWDPGTQSCRGSGTASSCPSFAHDMGGYCMLNADPSRCSAYGRANSEGNYTTVECNSSPPGGGSWEGSLPGQCSDGIDNDYDGAIDSADTSCTTPPPGPTYSPGPGGSSCSQSLINLLGNGCHWMSNDSSGRAVYCDGPMSKSAKEGDTAATVGCLSGGPYQPTYTPGPGGTFACSDGLDNDGDGAIDYPADSGCYGTTDNDEIIPPGVPPGGSCPAGAHNMGSYCMSDADTSKCGSFGSTSVSSFGSCSQYQGTTSYTPAPACPSGQWWDGAANRCTSSGSCGYGFYWDPGTNSCRSSTSTSYTPYPSGSVTYSPGPSSCPTGSHSMGSYCMSDSDGSKCGPISSSSVSSFGSCSTYQGGTTTYTPAPSCPSGQWWDSATNACRSTTATTYSPPPSCPSGQWWDYGTNSCRSSTSTSTYTPPPACPDGQYWDSGVSACRVNPTPYPTTAYTPPPTQYVPPPTNEATPPPSPPPTSYNRHQHYVAQYISTIALANTIMDCTAAGDRWNAKDGICRDGDASFFANIIRFIANFLK